MMSEGQTLPPDADRIEAIARATIARLPAAFAEHLGDVVLRIEEIADDDVLAELGIEHPLDLTGLYTGRPIGEKSVSDIAAMPDMIHLYRRAILDEWIDTDVSLEALVAHVVIHEIGHHFGLSDADMHALEELAG
jgi:predicted Zn-dependent protease with MMP-like domain